MSNWTFLLAFFGFFFTICWIVFVLVGRREKEAKARTESFSRILDKLGSAREVIELSESEGGKRLLETLGSQPKPFGMREQILRSLRIGVVLAMLGAALLILPALGNFEDEQELTVYGAISLALGVGFLVATGLSYRLGRSLGLLHPERPGARPAPETRS